MERAWKYKAGHLIFWIATVLFHMYTRITLVSSAGVEQFLLEIAVRNVLLAGIIYLNLRVLIPAFARRGRVAPYVLLLTLSIILYAFLKNIHDVYLFGYVLQQEEHRYFFHSTFYNISIALFYVAFSVALELSREWYEQRELIRRKEVEKLNTELEYLKAQINPHFLFNSINTIYFQIDKQNKGAREMLSSFSDMLRYQLYECNVNEISIEKEIDYLQHYVSLQRMRKETNCRIEFDIGPNVSGFSIAPLLLIPFIENAFKHVSRDLQNNGIKIALARTGDTFSIRVFNTRERASRPDHHDGIGLRNVKRRLALIYNGSHKLDISEHQRTFETSLSIRINGHK